MALLLVGFGMDDDVRDRVEASAKLVLDHAQDSVYFADAELPRQLDSQVDEDGARRAACPDRVCGTHVRDTGDDRFDASWIDERAIGEVAEIARNNVDAGLTDQKG